MPEPERTSLPSSNGDVGMSDQKANTGAIINEKSVPQQRDECRSLKNVEGEGDEDDPNRHLAKVDIPRDVRNRVKLYVLCDQRIWDDKGTGHVACVSSPEHQGATFIVVRLEHNEKNVLESRILMDTIYQKQQETLIVWSESDTCDLALSFQDKSGCEHIWEKICQVQGRDPEQHPDFTGNYDDLEDGDGLEAGNQAVYNAQRAVNAAAVTLPPCELSRLQDLEVLLSSSFSSAQLREKLALAIENQGYVAKLCDLFHMCEDLENVEALRIMHQIARDMFMLNRNGLLEVLLNENYFRNIVGMLEYDPTQPQPRRHREFLFEKARFREVLPIRNDELRQKIHQTYRVQYVQDVCLPAPSLFEENLLSVLNSYLFFNRVDIVSMLQEDKQLLKELFDQLKDPSISTERRKDLTMFLKEFCSFSTSLQPNGPQGREVFYKTLMQNDVLATIEPCIMSKDPQTMATTVEMFVMIVEFNPQTARDYLLQQGRNLSEAKNNQVLLNRLIERMLSDADPELASGMAMAQVMRSLLDPDSMISAPNSKCERHEFLTFFYRRSMETLCRAIVENTADGIPKKDDYHTANKQAMVVDLLCFCFEHHAVHMRNYCINNKLLNKVLVLLQSKHHFLALSALRLLRRVVQLKDEFYFRYIVRDDVMRPVVQCFRQNGHRYNLMNSAIIELFEFIRAEDIKILITYVVEKYGEQFEDISYVKTFAALRIKCDQIKDRESSKLEQSPSKSPSDESSTCAQWKKERQADADEQWFNDDDAENVAQTTGEDWDASKELREGAANGAARSPLREDSDSLTKRPGDDVSPSSSAESSKIKEETGDEKGSDMSFSPMRKSGAEPNFPSVVKRKLADDESEGVFSSATNASKVRTTPRIIIKMNTDRRSPCRSPPAGSGSPPGDPVVSSTEVLVTPSSSSPLERPSAPLPSPPITVLVKKALVDYDESDSDEEEESGESSLPSSSSSAGRPLSSPNSQLSSASTDEHDDVSSTSGDHEPSPGSAGEDDDGVEEHWEQNHDAVNDSGSLEIIRRKRAAKCEKASEPKVEGNNKGEEMAFQTGGKRLRLEPSDERDASTDKLTPTAALVS